jgi:hypothetical protein
MDGGEEAKKQKKLGNWEKWKKIIEKIRDKRTVKKRDSKIQTKHSPPPSLTRSLTSTACARRVYEL